MLRNRVVSAPFMQTFLAGLPIPTVGLSEGCGQAPWWLIYIGHEVGHHLQHDLAAKRGSDEVPRLLQDAVVAAAAAGTAAPRRGRKMGSLGRGGVRRRDLGLHLGPARPGRSPSWCWPTMSPC